MNLGIIFRFFTETKSCLELPGIRLVMTVVLSVVVLWSKVSLCAAVNCVMSSAGVSRVVTTPLTSVVA